MRVRWKSRLPSSLLLPLMTLPLLLPACATEEPAAPEPAASLAPPRTTARPATRSRLPPPPRTPESVISPADSTAVAGDPAVLSAARTAATPPLAGGADMARMPPPAVAERSPPAPEASPSSPPPAVTAPAPVATLPSPERPVLYRVVADGTVGCASATALRVVRGTAATSPAALRLLAQARAEGGCVTAFRVNEWAMVAAEGDLVRLRLVGGGTAGLLLYFFRQDAVATTN